MSDAEAAAWREEIADDAPRRTRFRPINVSVPPLLAAALDEHAASLPPRAAMACAGFRAALAAIGVDVPEEAPQGRTAKATEAARASRATRRGR